MRITQNNLQELDAEIRIYLRRKWRGLVEGSKEYIDIKAELLSDAFLLIANNENLDIGNLVNRKWKKYSRDNKRELLNRDYNYNPEELPNPDDINKSFVDKSDNTIGLKLHRIWQQVPKLRLSSTENKVFSLYTYFNKKYGSTWGFEKYCANQLNISQPAVSDDLKRAKNKMGISALLLPETFSADKLFGFFGNDWSNSAIRDRIWPLLKPGKERSAGLVKLLKPYQNKIFHFAERALVTFSKNTSSSPILFYQGYHAIILGTYIDPDSINPVSFELTRNVVPKSWLAGRAVARQSHLLNEKSKWEEYRDWLLELFFNDKMNEEKERYIGYMVGYFGGFDKFETYRYVSSKGYSIPHKYDVDKLIKEHYLNISETLYRRSPLLMEINFLRIALILSTFSRFDFCHKSINCLSQIIRQTKNVSDHSKIYLIISIFENKLRQSNCK